MEQSGGAAGNFSSGEISSGSGGGWDIWADPVAETMRSD